MVPTRDDNVNVNDADFNHSNVNDADRSTSEGVTLTSLIGKAWVPFQLLAGGAILIIILIPLPILYLVLFARYKRYVAQRERVIRGLQRNDTDRLEDVEAPRESISRGSISDHKLMYFTRSTILSKRMLSSYEKYDTDVEVDERLLSNYSGTYQLTCNVADIKEEKDIVEMVRVARETRVCIHAMGSLFSWPNIVEPGSCGVGNHVEEKKKGIVLDMKSYNKLVKVIILPKEQEQSDGTVALVKVQAGMKVWQLCELLDKLGYTMPVLGNVTGQSVGGVVSTGTHGKNNRFGTISSLVQSVGTSGKFT